MRQICSSHGAARCSWRSLLKRGRAMPRLPSPTLFEHAVYLTCISYSQYGYSLLQQCSQADAAGWKERARLPPRPCLPPPPDSCALFVTRCWPSYWSSASIYIAFWGRFQGVDSVTKVYLSPDNASSREEFEVLWKALSDGLKTVPVTLR